MRRWNGWGDESVAYPLHEGALAFLADRIGMGTPFEDAPFEAACATLAPSRLSALHAPAGIALHTDAPTRVRHALGQSLPDWLRLRYGCIGTAPDGVAFPESGTDVRALLDWAKAQRVTIIPYGGGTSVAGHVTAQPAARPVLTVALARLAQLVHLDREAQLATFGAGVFGPDLEAQLRAHGCVLGHYPQSFEYSTLGGWIATRSSGQQSLRYGRIEQLFAGGVVETPRGTLAIPSFPASAAGTDLREIVLGSEGRLGIVTEATVRVSPAPEYEAFHAVFFPRWEDGIAAARALAQARAGLSLLRLSNPTETVTMLALAGHRRLVGLLERWLRARGCGEGRCMLLIGVSGTRAQARSALAGALATCRPHRGRHVGRTLGDKWRQGRFRNVYLRNAAWQHGYAIDTVETAVDWPRVTATMQAVEAAAVQALAGCGESVHAYTHLSHLYPQGASVYSTFVYRLAGDFDTDMARWRALKGAVSGAIVANGGTISHQHGVGTDHAPYLAAEKGAEGLAAIRALLHHFDPDGMLNPGKLVTEPA
ncbi:FAD-binding oxidoreductase [Pseudoduganella chitinolytica]|uniref:FAD-binding oxidoreductase n=1 Tax=Pseudoduganella chitinolytica TaxID=34070 RepID=A0ABY8BFG8_9BURK|nr:FAD-binding oxidoreductase [Pseudoduganella chitinolytica]WEF33748.1 FAD-binding oxidoreductase [Pseudoduganella chitinolytica]